ncbi:MAG: DUF4423 domain-containing protein, partial [Bdellovibrionales bacterium]|nr:DUF4423 domain-containing protein [Bdellovibrionales bacterium]
KKEQTNFSLRKLAHSVPMQYTYLSKILNDDSIHLSEDHCFRIAKLLDLDSFETDILLLLRAYQSTSDPDRRQHLKNKIENLSKDKRLNAKAIENAQEKITSESSYLLDPMTLLIHLALHVPKYLAYPQRLCADLHISESRLKKSLHVLERCGFIITESEDVLRIKEIREGHMHFGKGHPLMRIGQNLMKSMIPSRLQVTEERDKHSFSATVTMSEHDFYTVIEEFQAFIQKVEKRVCKSPSEGVFQISFDLFKWL